MFSDDAFFVRKEYFGLVNMWKTLYSSFLRGVQGLFAILWKGFIYMKELLLCITAYRSLFRVEELPV